MKKLLAFSLLFFGMIAHAQTTAVTASIADSDGNAWQEATFTATFSNPSQSQLPVWIATGLPIQTVFTGNALGNGSINVTLPDNNFVYPKGSWNFTLCPRASSPCQTVSSVFVTGATQTLTTQLRAGITAPRFSCINSCFGYSTVEIVNPSAGALFYNTTSTMLGLYTYSGSIWQGPLISSASGYLPLAGGTMTGPIVLPGNPTLALQAAPKQYADLMLPLAGGTMTGPIVLPGNPTLALQAAPKQYADLMLPLAGGTMTGKLNTPASATGGAGFTLPPGTAPTSPVNGDLWTTSTGLYARINGSTVGPLSSGVSITHGLAGPYAGATLTITTPAACVPSSTCTYELTHCSNSGTLGQFIITGETAGTSFNIGNTSGTDTSTVCWMVF